MTYARKLAGRLLEDDFDHKDYAMAAADDPDAWQHVLKSRGFELSPTRPTDKIHPEFAKYYDVVEGTLIVRAGAFRDTPDLLWSVQVYTRRGGPPYHDWWSKSDPASVSRKLDEVEKLIERHNHEPEQIVSEIWRLQ